MYKDDSRKVRILEKKSNTYLNRIIREMNKRRNFIRLVL